MGAWLGGAVAVLAVVAVTAANVRAAEQKVDLNRATVEELATLPGIGEAKAQAIVAHREATPFQSVDDLLRVKGIGDRLLEQLRDRVAVTTANGARASGAGSGSGAGGDRAEGAAKGAQPSARRAPSAGGGGRGDGGAGS